MTLQRRETALASGQAQTHALEEFFILKTTFLVK